MSFFRILWIVFVVGVLGTLATFVIILGLKVLFHWFQEQTNERKSSAPTEHAQRAADQEARLQGYAWIDRKQKKVRVPIERAIDLVLGERSRKPGGGK